MRNRLRVLRAERGWTQKELGGRIGVSRQAVNAIETGKHDPSLPLAFRLARTFGTGIEEIFDDGERREEIAEDVLQRQGYGDAADP